MRHSGALVSVNPEIGNKESEDAQEVPSEENKVEQEQSPLVAPHHLAAGAQHLTETQVRIVVKEVGHHTVGIRQDDTANTQRDDTQQSCEYGNQQTCKQIRGVVCTEDVPCVGEDTTLVAACETQERAVDGVLEGCADEKRQDKSESI